jgi:hypothetical protein
VDFGMITGDIKNQIDRIWDAFWSGGISNPLEVIEQITYLLFLRRLDDLHTLEENKSVRLKRPMERTIFPKGKDAKGRPYDRYRWSRYKNLAPAEMYSVVGEHVFPFRQNTSRKSFKTMDAYCLSANLRRGTTVDVPLLIITKQRSIAGFASKSLPN